MITADLTMKSNDNGCFSYYINSEFPSLHLLQLILKHSFRSIQVLTPLLKHLKFRENTEV